VDTSGNVLERYQYDPFGAVSVLSPTWSVESGSNYNVPYGFQGMRYDWTVGVNFADNRVYCPTLMRWLQSDPLGLGPDNNDYRMEGNGPTDGLDPSGLAEGAAVAGAVVGGSAVAGAVVGIAKPQLPDLSDDVNDILHLWDDQGDLGEDYELWSEEGVRQLILNVANELGVPPAAVADAVSTYVQDILSAPDIKEEDIAKIPYLSESDFSVAGGWKQAFGIDLSGALKDFKQQGLDAFQDQYIEGPEHQVAAALGGGSGGSRRKGGEYGKVRAANRGGEVHHMPAAQVTPYPYKKAPASWMKKADHRKTASWGSSKAAQAYRQKQADLIKRGKLRKAIQMDIDDIRKKFGSKCDANIKEMLDCFGFK
jgi:RHS repeat-associated protein